MSYKINDQERQALRGLPHLQRLVYSDALRPYMDFQTGIVGIQRGVSYQSIVEELYVEPHQGYKSGSPSKDQIRRALKGLEKVGLIQLNSTSKKLIVLCQLADKDNFTQNKAATKAPSKPANKKALGEANFTEDLTNIHGKSATQVRSKAATPPVSGYYNTLSLRERAEKISERFQPSPDIIEKAQQQACPTALCPDELTKFICYHKSKGTQCCDWNAEFLRWLLIAKHYHQEKKYDRSRNTGKSQHVSAVERVVAAYRAPINEKSRLIESDEQGYCFVVGEYD